MESMITKVIRTTTSPDSIRELQEMLMPCGIQLNVYEDDFSGSDTRILVFHIPEKKGE